VGDGEGVGVIVGSRVGLGVSVGRMIGVGDSTGKEKVGRAVPLEVGRGAPVELGPGVGVKEGPAVAWPDGVGVGPGTAGRLSAMKIVTPTSTISRNAKVAATTCAERLFTGSAA
jgi:hypothetical protein